MPLLPVKLTRDASQPELVAALAAIRAELELPTGFSPEVLAEAEQAVSAYRLPELDLTEIPFATIDPAGSTDLDQALAIERDGAGWRVFYAIADLAGFVAPGGAIDAEARERGQTLYAPDGRIPLHPVAISEGAASLLPGVDRGAFVWEFALDAAGRETDVRVRRARVRSRRQWTYEEAQRCVDSEPMLGLLRGVGEALVTRESERSGASLATPEILVVRDDNGYRLERRVVVPIASWNAQLSLLTGMAAARMMLDAGTGILRTMPPAEPEAIEHFRRQTIALGTPWAVGERYGDYLRRLDTDDPAQIAIRHAAASLFRGASYAPFDGAPPADPPSAEWRQAAIGAPYAHVTAPLRRLVDRFALEICVAVSAGTEVPAWVRAALPELPAAMGRSANTSGRLSRRTLDTVEAAVLAPHVGEQFDAHAITDETVQLLEPAVEARCEGSLEPGEPVRVRLVEAEISTGTVRFSVS